ncbi:lantibiotic dehydratase [Micromonospora sp. HM134]|uniref:lantibiotic dehydratase n=1 Tax=Micromonospora sp. HM134 TaxID=2583243 RepID=UPI001198BDE4|nr:lantibiotic dehydratase [Micromonospora sp. HM134]QDY11216.1 lantibiotic dehydratase [Micromonospora sp. HM134]
MYRHLDALMVRATPCPADRLVGWWPDLIGAQDAGSWRWWLGQVFAAPRFAAAVELASPVLADRVRAVCDGRVGEGEARRVVMSVLRYLLRMRGRATPYGFFAGVAPARLAPTTAVCFGDGHRAVLRVRAAWLSGLVDGLEADPVLRPHLMVRANNLLTCRDGQIVLEHRTHQKPGKRTTKVHVRAAGPVLAALTAAADPIRLGDLAAVLAADHGAPVGVVHALLARMVSQRLLLTALRPPTTCTDPLSAVTAGLQQAMADADAGTPGDSALAQARATLAVLRTLSEWAVSDTATPGARLAETMTGLHPADEPPVAMDLRLDADVCVPEVVAVEVASAAGALVRLAAAGNGGWAAWHRRFLERYGPHAVVPVRDAVDADLGLGYPAGYRGATSAPPPALTARDRKLMALAQDAALRREREVVLDDVAIADLNGGAPIVSVQPSTELTVTVHARTTRDLDRGEFQLEVVGVSRNAGTVTGRFLDLLDPADRKRMTGEYAALPQATRGALRVQVSAAALYTVTEDVARAPHVMPHHVSLGEYHDNAPDRIALDDIAVTADADRIYLVSVSRRRVVEPIVLNAVEQVHYTLPIVRFLTEAPTAFTAPCDGFDWGAASGLPFLPALRYQRTILSPARWLLPANALPAPAASWREWSRALASWRDTTGCPPEVYLGDSDQRIRLDLAEPAHQALLRDHLRRTPTAVLRAAPPPDTAGWMDGRAHEIVVPLAATVDPAPPPHTLATAPVVDVREHGHLPGVGEHLFVKLYGHPDRQTPILTRHLPSLLRQLDPQTWWWFLRYGDPDPHLRLRLTGSANLATLAEWTAGLRRVGLIARVQIDTDYPETGRFGGPTADTAAAGVFAADSAAAVTQLAAIDRGRASDVRAVTAASLLHLTTALIGNTTAGMQWLIDHTRPQRSAPPRDVYQRTITLANPDQTGLDVLGDGTELRAAWQRRREALTTYRATLHGAGTAVDRVLPDLLHLHHTRMIGPDPDSERACLHLARAAALSWTVRPRNEP